VTYAAAVSVNSGRPGGSHWGSGGWYTYNKSRSEGTIKFLTGRFRFLLTMTTGATEACPTILLFSRHNERPFLVDNKCLKFDRIPTIRAGRTGAFIEIIIIKIIQHQID
jgi:hypothetical protein